MARFIRSRSKKAGLPPGTPVHVGREREEAVSVTVIDYDQGRCEETAIEHVGECAAYKDRPSVTWINVDGVHEVGVIEELGRLFALHPLILEDVVNTAQRPKLEAYEDHIYVVIKMLTIGDGGAQVDAEQVSIIMRENVVISFQERPGDVFNPVRERIKSARGRIRRMGADYLLYSLIDAVVDNYFAICEDVGDRIEPLHDALISEPAPGTLGRVHELKNELLFLRRSVWPLREVVSGLERSELPIIAKPTRLYMRDVYDHTIQVIDTIETYRDMIGGMVDLYLSSVSNRMNEVMKVLTIIATLFIPLTFVAGIYGMNFEHMPELGWKYGYLAVLAVMALIVAAMLYYFRRRDWL